jgi:hypothetical protein
MSAPKIADALRTIARELPPALELLASGLEARAAAPTAPVAIEMVLIKTFAREHSVHVTATETDPPAEQLSSRTPSISSANDRYTGAEPATASTPPCACSSSKSTLTASSRTPYSRRSAFYSPGYRRAPSPT